MAWAWRRLRAETSLSALIAKLNDALLKLQHELTPRVQTMRSGDATPSVKDVDVLLTAGTTTVTGFDDGFSGQRLTVISLTSITFDTTSSGLSGSSADLATASGDVTEWVTEDGMTWRLTGFVDASADNSSGA